MKKRICFLFLINLVLWVRLDGQVNKKTKLKKRSIIKTEHEKITIPNKKLRFPKSVSIIEEHNGTIRNYAYHKKKENYKLKGASKKSTIKSIVMNNETAIFRFKKKSIKDSIGIDLYLFSKSNFFELESYLSKDQKEWKKLDQFTAEKPYLDLSNLQENKFTYVKIKNTTPNDKEVIIDKIAIKKSKKGEIGIVKRMKDNRIITKSDEVFLKFYDFGRIDFDRVSISMNGKTLIESITLVRWNRFIQLPLRPGENKIEVTSLSEGQIKPTTVDIKVVDGITISIGKFRLKKNRKKTFVIERM